MWNPAKHARSHNRDSDAYYLGEKTGTLYKSGNHPVVVPIRKGSKFEAESGQPVFNPQFQLGRSRYPSTILSFKEANQKRIHPFGKPLALLEYLIKTYTNEGFTVLDPCMGSGTTGIACRKLGRNFIGIERNQDWFVLARDRIYGTPVKESVRTINVAAD